MPKSNVGELKLYTLPTVHALTKRKNATDKPIVIHKQSFFVFIGSSEFFHPNQAKIIRDITINTQTVKYAFETDAPKVPMAIRANTAAIPQRSIFDIFINRERTKSITVKQKVNNITRPRDMCAKPSNSDRSRKFIGSLKYSMATAVSHESMIWRIRLGKSTYFSKKDLNFDIITPPVAFIVQGVSFVKLI